jgi:hypothetical protein
VSTFTDAFNLANTAFGVIAGETFEIPAQARLGVPGSYSAIAVDDMKSMFAVAPGGKVADNNTLLFVKRTVMATAGLVEGVILVVRSHRVRVMDIIDEGDDTMLITCGPSGISIR